MAKHWNPEEELARAREAEAKAVWPAGATAGLLLVAAGCAAMTALLYWAAGPKDVFAP